jgi:hypothetical protein
MCESQVVRHTASEGFPATMLTDSPVVEIHLAPHAVCLDDDISQSRPPFLTDVLARKEFSTVFIVLMAVMGVRMVMMRVRIVVAEHLSCDAFNPPQHFVGIVECLDVRTSCPVLDILFLFDMDLVTA